MRNIVIRFPSRRKEICFLGKRAYPTLLNSCRRLTNTGLLFSVISACLITVLRELELACEPALTTVISTSWSNVENVSGRSPYVSDLVGSIKSVAEVVRERINHKKYVRSFADKAVG
jgi:hypothetical protein